MTNGNEGFTHILQSKLGTDPPRLLCDNVFVIPCRRPVVGRLQKKFMVTCGMRKSSKANCLSPVVITYFESLVWSFHSAAGEISTDDPSTDNWIFSVVFDERGRVPYLDSPFF